jgi:hypothetical protein
LEFSEKIYSVMGKGGTVVITKKGATPSRSSRPAGVMLASRAANAADRAIPDPSGEVVWEPSKSPSGPFSILISYADKRIYVWRNGVQIGQGPISIAGTNPPEGVFLMLEGEDPSDPRFPGVKMHPWTALSLDGGNTSGDVVGTMRSQVNLPTAFHKKISKIVGPGAILVATRQSSSSATRSDRDFTIMKPEGGE